MTNSVRPANLAAILAVGEELRLLLHEEQPPLIKDRRYHLKQYPKCFVGSELVDWLLGKGEVNSRTEAVAMMQKLCENGVIHHVCDDHSFKDERLFFRFRKDDGTYEEPPNTTLLAKGEQLYSRLCGESPPLIQDRKYHLSTYKACFVGSQLVDWLVQEGEASNRDEAVRLGRELLEAGIFAHVCYDHHFKDEFLFYRFKCDEKEKTNGLLSKLSLRSPSTKRKESTSSTSETSERLSETSLRRGSGTSDQSGGANARPVQPGSPRISATVPPRAASRQPDSPRSPVEPPRISPDEPPRISPDKPPRISPDKPPQVSPVEPPRVSQSAPSATPKPTLDELCNPDGLYVKRRVDVASDPVGYGFVIRGSNPVYVHSVDPSGPAAAVGLMVDEYLYSVNGRIVLNSSHTEAAKIILMGPSTASLITFIRKDRLPSSCPVIL